MENYVTLSLETHLFFCKDHERAFFFFAGGIPMCGHRVDGRCQLVQGAIRGPAS